MATHDYVIDNQTALTFRADLNNVLQAIVSQNSSATAPTSPYADMIWYDTTANQLKKRNEANSAWITLGTIDEGLGIFTPSGQAVIASQAEAEAGTENTKMMTALRSAQAIAALGGISAVNIQVFTTSGVYTPTAGYKRALAFVTGGGRQGGGGTGGGTGTGGAAGNTVIGIINLVGLAAQAVTVGAGGGGDGGTSSLGALLSASGGGQTIAMTGTVQIRGGQGAGGGSMGSAGGGSFWGGGPQGTMGTPGPSAVAYGAGGAGGQSNSGTYTGGSGAGGIVMLVEFK